MQTIYLSQNSSDYSQNDNQDYFCIDRPVGPLIWAGYSACFVLLGLPPSLKVLQELCQRRRQNNTNDFFVFNLTVIDLVYLSVLPIGVTNYIVWQNIELEYICNFMSSLTISGRPLFMACVCEDYYFAVVHPITYMASKRTAMIRKAIAMMIYLFIVFFGCFIAPNPQLYSTVLTSTPLFIALPVIGFCDISVYQALRRKYPTGKTPVHPQKKRAMRTIISSFVMTFTVYLPPAVVFSMGHNPRLRNATFNCILIFIALFFTALGCVIMPLLYLESIGQLNMLNIGQKLKWRR